MIKGLKKLLVPHKHNDYKPHLFREGGAFVLFSLIIVLFVLAVSGRTILDKTNLTALILPKVLVDYANENRATENYKNLAINSTLEKAAQLKADDMAEKGYFAHTTPDGHSPWYFFQKAGYDFSYAGENLAVNFTDSVDVSKAWMNSPGHRANIMNSNFTQIGIATAEGMYQGRHTVFVVELFGTPAVAETVTTPTKIPTTTTPKPVVKKVSTTTPTTAKQTVLAESIAPPVTDANGNSQIFISVEKKSAPASTTSAKPYSSFFEKMLVSPNKILTSIYLILAILITIVLALMVFVEIRSRHPRMILLALGLLVIIAGLWYIYQFVIFSPLAIV